jgi:sulfotransferase
MDKKYYFLAGFFRSGNTVLSSILNQNPEIYSSPISSLIEHMWQSNLILNNYEASTVNKEDYLRSKTLISNMPKNYYENVGKNIIFDRSKAWTNPDNMLMIKEYITKKPKIVFTTRPIIEMMASFIKIDSSTIIFDMNNSGFEQDKKLSLNDNLADFLYSGHSNFGKQLIWSFQSIDNPSNAGMIYVVKYEELLNTPQETMNNIYTFLDIEPFKHNFTNIKKIEEYNESAAGLPKDLHKIRRKLGRGEVRVEDYLTPRSIEKYKDARYY